MRAAQGSRQTICVDCNTSEVSAMKALLLIAILVSPALIGSVAVSRLEGPSGFIVALAVSMILLREAMLICMILMRHWQLFGQDLFLIEQNGRHRWVDAIELKAMSRPFRVRAREFRPAFLQPPRHRDRGAARHESGGP
jgi:hypothetical protein